MESEMFLNVVANKCNGNMKQLKICLYVYICVHVVVEYSGVNLKGYFKGISGMLKIVFSLACHNVVKFSTMKI